MFIWGREGVKWARDLVSVIKLGRCELHEGSMLLPSYILAYYSYYNRISIVEGIDGAKIQLRRIVVSVWCYVILTRAF